MDRNDISSRPFVSGQRGESIATTDFQVKSRDLDNGNLGSVISIQVPVILTVRRLYFAIVANDLGAYELTGRLEFILNSGPILALPISEGFPIAGPSYANLCFGKQWTRVVNPALETNFELSQSTDLCPDEIQFRCPYTNTYGRPTVYTYIVRLAPFHLTVACTAIELVVEKILKLPTVNYTPGFFRVFLACASS